MKAFFLPGAEQDLAEGVSFYDEASPDLGNLLIDEVEQTLAHILQNPQIGRREHGPTRSFPLRRFPYDIIYLVESERVVVVAVAHHRRGPGFWLER